MTEVKKTIEGHSVVLRGNFNTSIFQPAWLSAHGLIQNSEADNAKIDVIHAEFSSFSCGEWLQIQVTSDRFAASTSDVSYRTVLCDLVVSIFTLLEHTPLSQLGINGQFHYQLDSEDRWHELGHRLAPKDVWGTLVTDPGTKSLTIQGKPAKGGSDVVNVKVEPSVRVHPGVYIEVNQHFDGKHHKELIGCLKSDWAVCQDYAQEIAEAIVAERT